MNFRWLQFWGDLRYGLHPSRGADMSVAPDSQIAPLIHHQFSSAALQRHALSVATHWDEGFAPEQAKWAVLGQHEFDRWCEAVGLLTLGEHLKRVISVRAIERLKVGLDRNTLASIVQYLNDQRIANTGPLPLDLPTAQELGARALNAACATQYPNLWSRLRLRLGPPYTGSGNLVFAPDMKQLAEFDAALFDSHRKGRNREGDQGGEDTWMQTRTLSA